MDKNIFEKEILMCRELSQKNGGKCDWGECDKCGVIPMLYKIGKGEIYEGEIAVKNLKEKILRDNNIE